MKQIKPLENLQWSRYLLRRCIHRTQVDEKFAYTNLEMCTNKMEKRMAHFKSTVPPSNVSAKYWNIVHKRCMLSFHNTHVPYVIICPRCSLRHFETESRFLHTPYASIASMILHSARFLCVLYTEICVNATAGTSHVNVKGLINSDFLGQDQVSLDKKPNLLQSFHDFSTAHCQLSFSLPLSMKRNPKIIPRRWQTKKAQLGDSWGIQRETISPVKLQGWRYLGFWYLECTRKALVF